MGHAASAFGISAVDLRRQLVRRDGILSAFLGRYGSEFRRWNIPGISAAACRGKWGGGMDDFSKYGLKLGVLN